jgi:cell fate regulator YaaT (PSP1 superfamily)
MTMFPEEPDTLEQDTRQEIKIRVVGIQLRERGKRVQGDPQDLALLQGDYVFISSDGGEILAQIKYGIRYVPRMIQSRPLKKVLRKVTPEERRKVDAHQQIEKEAAQYCMARVRNRGLKMKVTDVEFLFDESKMVFYFSADDRVDFRELVKDIAYKYRAKIEMRQIGVRDGARMMDGYGPCGRPLCCSNFLMDFGPVSIRMARDQGLVLSPSKTSGLCGRLKCCIAYEHGMEKEPKDKGKGESEVKGS